MITNLRIGDQERDAAAESLSGHFAAGRLDQTEFEERLAAAYAAKTGAELAPLFADLPGAQQALQVRERHQDRARVGRSYGPLPFHPVFALIALALVVSSVAAIANGYPPVLLFVAFVIFRTRRRHVRHGWR
jgi:Domain of unknown function (DUF1707)